MDAAAHGETEGNHEAEVIDFQSAQAKRLSEMMTPAMAKERLDQLAEQYSLPRADDGVHMSLEVLHDPSGGRLDPEVLQQIMAAEEAYDVAGDSEAVNPPAVGE